MKRGYFLLLVGVILSTFLLLPDAESQETSPTNLTVGEISNIQPSLIQIIPNQTWAMNTNLTNVFNLSDYFTDNETLNYTASSVENITVIINESFISVFNETTNSTENITTFFVSFIPDYNFTGIRNVTFTATDGELSKTSNIVFLNVTEDNRPPQWSNPAIDQSIIFQNDVIQFSASWTDNVQLANYILSVNQGSGFVNQTLTSFSGVQNTSSYVLQISAPGGTTVRWFFYATDTSGNSNQTEIQSFTVSRSTGGGGGSDDDDDDDGTDASSGAVIPPVSPAETEGLTIQPSDPILLEVKQGGSNSVTLLITNTGSKNSTFSIQLKELEELSHIISDPDFTLSPGESKSVVIEISADRFLTPDIYFGEIDVRTSERRRLVELAVQVIPFISEFDLFLEVLPEYKEIKPGETVMANITLKNLKDIEENKVSLNYVISDFSGNFLDISQEEFSFSEGSITLTRNLTAPEIVKPGKHIFYARATIGKEILIDSDTFIVGERFNLAAFIKSNILFILIILFALTGVILGMKRHHDKEKMKLLNLYLMINEMKTYLEEEKTEQAIDLYIRIKKAYGQPLSQTAVNNRKNLLEEMKKLTKKVDSIISQKLPAETAEGEEKPSEKKEAIPENEKDEKKEGSEESKIEEKKPEKTVEAPKKEAKKEIKKQAEKPEKKEAKTEAKEK